MIANLVFVDVKPENIEDFKKAAAAEELAVQLPYAKRAANALGFTIIEKEGYEADDIIGTLIKKADEDWDFYFAYSYQSPLRLGVHCIAQAVAHKVEGKNGDNDQNTCGNPKIGIECHCYGIGRSRNHGSPRRVRQRNSESEIT